MQSRKQVLTWCTHIFIPMSNVYQVWKDTAAFQCMIRSEVFLCGSCDARIYVSLVVFRELVLGVWMRMWLSRRLLTLPGESCRDDYDIRCLAVQSRQYDLNTSFSFIMHSSMYRVSKQEHISPYKARNKESSVKTE